MEISEGLGIYCSISKVSLFRDVTDLRVVIVEARPLSESNREIMEDLAKNVCSPCSTLVMMY